MAENEGVDLLMRAGLIACAAGLLILFFGDWRGEAAGTLFATLLLILTAAAATR